MNYAGLLIGLFLINYSWGEIKQVDQLYQRGYTGNYISDISLCGLGLFVGFLVSSYNFIQILKF